MIVFACEAHTTDAIEFEGQPWPSPAEWAHFKIQFLEHGGRQCFKCGGPACLALERFETSWYTS